MRRAVTSPLAPLNVANMCCLCGILEVANEWSPEVMTQFGCNDPLIMVRSFSGGTDMDGSLSKFATEQPPLIDPRVKETNSFAPARRGPIRAISSRRSTRPLSEVRHISEVALKITVSGDPPGEGNLNQTTWRVAN